jgi:hypothetical protein
MIRRSTHEATLILILLLLLKGSSLLWLVVILILLNFAFVFTMCLRLVHQISTGLAIDSFRLFVLSLCFLLNIKRDDQVQNRHRHPLAFESNGKVLL